MTQTTGRLFDNLGRLMTDAVGVADGMKREVDTMVRRQAERILGDMDLVRREEFEAMRELAVNARVESERLAARVAALEAKLGLAPDAGPAQQPAGDEPSPAA